MAMKVEPTPWQIKHPNAAGIDVGSSQHYVAVPADRCEKPVRSFGTCTGELLGLAQWLSQCGVDTVVMEATGVYWVGLYELLSERGFKVCLTDARRTQNVSGRKSDVLDCQWLQQLMTYGLLTSAFIPDEPICQIRTVTRERERLRVERGRRVQLMQKALTLMNVQLHTVLTELMASLDWRLCVPSWRESATRRGWRGCATTACAAVPRRLQPVCMAPGVLSICCV